MIESSQIPLLKAFAPWDQIHWIRSDDGTVFFEYVENQERRFGAVCFFVRKEESDIWKACHAMLAEGVRLAAGWVQGLYGFEMIAMELDEGIRHFRLGDLGRLLTNHSRQMAVGESRLIRYGGLWGVFKKRIPESYGKIEFKSCVKIYSQDADRLDLFLSGFLRKCRKFLGCPSVTSLMVCDLSDQRIFNLDDTLQQERLETFYKKIGKPELGGVSLARILYRHEREEFALWTKNLSENQSS